MRGRGEDGNELVPGPEPRRTVGTVYRIDAPEAAIGVWNGKIFVAISTRTGSLIETEGRIINRIGEIEDSHVRLETLLLASCSYCGGNLEQGPTGQWVSTGACRCDPPSPFKPENRALKAELEDLTPLDIP